MIVDDDISAEIEHQVQSTAQLLLVFVSQLASQLVCMPGHPEHGPFYLVKALLQVLDEHEWDKGTITKAQINLRIVALLAAISQQKFIYGIPDSTTRAGRCLHLAIVCAAGSLTHDDDLCVAHCVVCSRAKRSPLRWRSGLPGGAARHGRQAPSGMPQHARRAEAEHRCRGTLEFQAIRAFRVFMAPLADHVHHHHHHRLQAKRLQAELAVELLNHTIAFAEVNQQSAQLISNLYELAKNCGAKPSTLEQCISFLRRYHAENPSVDDISRKLR